MDGQRDSADMVSRMSDPDAQPRDVDGAGRKVGKASRAGGKGAHGETVEMLSRFRDEPDVEMMDSGMLVSLPGWA